MQIEHIKNLSTLKAMEKAVQCHLKRNDTTSELSCQEIKDMEEDIIRIQFRIAEIELTKKAVQEAVENYKK